MAFILNVLKTAFSVAVVFIFAVQFDLAWHCPFFIEAQARAEETSEILTQLDFENPSLLLFELNSGRKLKTPEDWKQEILDAAEAFRKVPESIQLDFLRHALRSNLNPDDSLGWIGSFIKLANAEELLVRVAYEAAISKNSEKLARKTSFRYLCLFALQNNGELRLNESEWNAIFSGPFREFIFDWSVRRYLQNTPLLQAAWEGAEEALLRSPSATWNVKEKAALRLANFGVGPAIDPVLLLHYLLMSKDINGENLDLAFWHLSYVYEERLAAEFRKNPSLFVAVAERIKTNPTDKASSKRDAGNQFARLLLRLGIKEPSNWLDDRLRQAAVTALSILAISPSFSPDAKTWEGLAQLKEGIQKRGTLLESRQIVKIEGVLSLIQEGYPNPGNGTVVLLVHPSVMRTLRIGNREGGIFATGVCFGLTYENLRLLSHVKFDVNHFKDSDAEISHKLWLAAETNEVQTIFGYEGLDGFMKEMSAEFCKEGNPLASEVVRIQNAQLEWRERGGKLLLSYHPFEEMLSKQMENKPTFSIGELASLKQIFKKRIDRGVPVNFAYTIRNEDLPAKRADIGEDSKEMIRKQQSDRSHIIALIGYHLELDQDIPTKFYAIDSNLPGEYSELTLGSHVPNEEGRTEVFYDRNTLVELMYETPAAAIRHDYAGKFTRSITRLPAFLPEMQNPPHELQK